MVPGQSEGVLLSFCGSEIRIDRSTFRSIAERENIEPFQVPPVESSAEGRFALRVVGPGEGGWMAFEPSSGASGAYRLTPMGIEVSERTNALGLSLALRGLFSLAVEREGGVLVHASCVSWDGRAVLITGVSGAGRSTLARWGMKAGGTLLSDEVVGVLPDGTVLGTPFRSDPDLLGTPTSAQLSAAVTLRHDGHESFEPLAVHRMVEALCEQTFRRGGSPTARQALICLGRAVERARTGVLACRNAAEAGVALRELVLAWSPPT